MFLLHQQASVLSFYMKMKRVVVVMILELNLLGHIAQRMMYLYRLRGYEKENLYCPAHCIAPNV